MNRFHIEVNMVLFFMLKIGDKFSYVIRTSQDFVWWLRADMSIEQF